MSAPDMSSLRNVGDDLVELGAYLQGATDRDDRTIDDAVVLCSEIIDRLRSAMEIVGAIFNGVVIDYAAKYRPDREAKLAAGIEATSLRNHDRHLHAVGEAS